MARPGQESDHRGEEFGCGPEDSRRMERLEGVSCLTCIRERGLAVVHGESEEGTARAGRPEW